MDENRTQPKARLPLPGIVVLTLMLVALVGCQTANQSTSQPAVGLAPTATTDRAEAGATFDAQKRDQQPFSPADDTRVAAAIATRKIELALTPSQPPLPTSTAGLPTPTIVWATGIMSCPLQASHRTYQPINCWVGRVDGNLVTVAVTVEGLGDTHSQVDRSYSVVLVINDIYVYYPFDAEDAVQNGIDFVKTPPNSGIMQISAAQGSLLTLVPLDPQAPPDTLYFDVATRQFVPPPCGQGSTCPPAVTPSQLPATPPPPQHSPTWELGVLPGCEAPNSHTFGPVSCWRGIINDQMFSIVSGNGGGNGDPNQGVIIVSEGPDFDIPLGYEEVPGRVYDSPDKIGPLHIVSVEGSRVTLGSVNPGINETLVFDIATRRFVPPSYGQGGTCTPVVTEVATPAATMTVAR